jgi:thiol-disulfide isomerase/thioredoxin
MRIDETIQALQEMQNFVNDHPDSPRIADVLYVRAEGAMNNHHPDIAKAKAFTEDFIRKLPHDERGADLLASLAHYSRPNEKRAFYRRIATDYAGTSRAKLAEGGLRQLDGIGKPIELSFNDFVSGKHVSMIDLRGKVVVIQFWSTTCGPCLAEMPSLRSTFATYKDQGVEFIGVNLDHPSLGLDAVKKCIADHKMTWPQYYQGSGWESEFSQSWGINAIPTLFVVDRDGNLHSTEARGRLEIILPKLLSSHAQKN